MAYEVDQAAQSMKGKSCCVMSYDYLDLDVWLNIRCFYRSAGYRVTTNRCKETDDLLVILRGHPCDQARRHRGPVHVYDYVKELKIDWREALPAASEVVVISIEPPSCSEGARWVCGYLPVYPPLWQKRLAQKSARPVHISNFKPMGEDHYQKELLELVRTGMVRVFGGRWERAGVRASSLSHWQANRMLAASSQCYGLMYPYQRGHTLSGRMWQAPINGCFVISEAGTNILACPGIIEVEHFDGTPPRPSISPGVCLDLAHQAREFWTGATATLAHDLKLVIKQEPSGSALVLQRLPLITAHLGFLQGQITSVLASVLLTPYRRARRCLGKAIRHLGLLSIWPSTRNR
ncbi:MAG TPA: hypothetical protein VER57_03560 [Cyanobium sp.]|nr:hypothetical protein [Cyanobium sp.]